MFHHDYDDSGLPTSYLFLTILVPLAAILSYRVCKSASHYPCHCSACRKNRRPFPFLKLAFSAALWAVVAFLCIRVYRGGQNDKKSDFDPREILGVEEGATISEIKKHYRRRLKTLSRSRDEAAASVAITNLNKAFEIVSNPEEYTKWLDHAVVEKQIVAIPLFLLREKAVSCLLYVLLLCALVPASLYIFNRRLERRSTYGVLYKSVESFWENIQSFGKDESVAIPQLILFMSRCPDFSSRMWEKDLSELKSVIENEYAIPMLSTSQSYIHIYDYLCRTGRASPSDVLYTRRTLAGMVESFSEVSRLCENEHMFATLSVLRRMVVQAVPSPAFSLMQFPNVTAKDTIKSGSKQPTGREDLEAMRAELESSLSGQALSEAMAVWERVPRVEVENFQIYVIDTESTDYEEVEGDFKKINCSGGAEVCVERGSTPTVSMRLRKTAGGGACHAPHFGEHPRVKWTLYYSLDNQMQPGLRIIEDFTGTQDIEFSFKFSNGKSSELKVVLLQDSYFGADYEKKVAIKYY